MFGWVSFLKAYEGRNTPKLTLPKAALSRRCRDYVVTLAIKSYPLAVEGICASVVGAKDILALSLIVPREVQQTLLLTCDAFSPEFLKKENAFSLKIQPSVSELLYWI